MNKIKKNKLTIKILSKLIQNIFSGEKKEVDCSTPLSNIMQSLEPRYMFDGAAVSTVDLADGVSESEQNEILAALSENNQADASDSLLEIIKSDALSQEKDYSLYREVIIIDSKVKDPNILIKNISRKASVEIIDNDTDGVVAVANILKKYSNLDAAHILSHGSQGELFLGNSILNLNNISSYQEQLTQWGNAISSHGGLLFYGCDVAKGDQGKNFIDILSGYTQADIAASDDITGGVNRGADSQLEYSSNNLLDANNIVNFDEYEYFLYPVDVRVIESPDALTNSPDATAGKFGDALAVSETGHIIAVGVPSREYDDGVVSTSDVGLVHIYHWNSTTSTWDEHTIWSDDTNQPYLFGSSVSLSADGTRLIVLRDATNEVSLYDYNGSAWIKTQDFTVATNGTNSDIALSADGLMFIIGSNDHDFTDGKVISYRYTGGTWVSTEILAFRPGENFGHSISLYHNGTHDEAIVVIGSDSANAVHVYEYNEGSNSWTHQDELNAIDSGTDSGIRFGESVDISDDGLRIIVGDSEAEVGKGIAHIYAYDGFSWVYEQELKHAGVWRHVNDWLGRSVSIAHAVENSEDTYRAIIGAPGDEGKGRAYVFTKSGTNNWNSGHRLITEQINYPVNSSSFFGNEVIISKDAKYMVVGSPFHEGKGQIYIHSERNVRVDNDNTIQAEEGVSNGRFIFTLTEDSSEDIVVHYTIENAGTPAEHLVDYTTQTASSDPAGQVTIKAGDLFASVDIIINDDNKIEVTESIRFRVQSVTGGETEYGIYPRTGLNTALTTIEDNDVGYVSIDIVDDGNITNDYLGPGLDVAVAYETGTVGKARFIIQAKDLSGSPVVSGTYLRVNYAIDQTVTPLADEWHYTVIGWYFDQSTQSNVYHQDYNINNNYIDIPANIDYVYIDIVHALDSLVEADNEEVKLTLTGFSNLNGREYYLDPNPENLTKTIILDDDDVGEVSVTVTDGVAREEDNLYAEFRIELDKTTDFGHDSDDDGDGINDGTGVAVTFELAGTADDILNPMTAIADYSVVLNSDPNDEITDVVYNGDGTYTARIKTLEHYGTIGINIINDDVVEDQVAGTPENIQLNILDVTKGHDKYSISATYNSATFDIIDDDTFIDVSIETQNTAPNPQIIEDGFSIGNYIVYLKQDDLPADNDIDVRIYFTVSGNATPDLDYTLPNLGFDPLYPNVGYIDILAGQNQGIIAITSVNDNFVEPTEDVIITLGTSTPYGDTDSNKHVLDTDNDQTSIGIFNTDDGLISVVANVAEVDEGDNLSFDINVDNATDNPIDIEYYFIGTASTSDGTSPDHNGLNIQTVTLPANTFSITVTHNTLIDGWVEGIEQATIQLNDSFVGGGPSGYIIDGGNQANVATIDIVSNESALISIAKILDPSESGTIGKFRVSTSSIAQEDIVVTYSLAGSTASENEYQLSVDAEILSGSLVIKAGTLFTDVDITLVDDSISELSDYLKIELRDLLNVPIDSDNNDLIEIDTNNDNHFTVINFLDNDNPPTITVETGNSDSASLTETDTTLSTSGTLTLTDLDTSDTVSVDVATVVESGNVSDITNSMLLAMLSVSAGNILDNTEIQDQFTWNFNSGSEAFNYLAAGETLILTYTIQSEDSQGKTDEYDVTITIVGSNDKPIISVEVGNFNSSEATLTESDSPLSASGTLTIYDLDMTDEVTGSVLSINVSGNVGGISNPDLLNMLNLSSSVILDSNNNTTQFGWNFNSGSKIFNHLAAGETLILTYTVRATDSQAATDDQSVVINITGTNDAPGITVESGDSASDTLVETDTALSTSGTLTLTDLDTSDTVSIDVATVVESGNVSGITNSMLLAMLSVSAGNILDNTEIQDQLT
ncbi:DUF4347 domain-containing protein, partial [Thiotrichales bacterium 19X7-9]|nr:DUF4347 domain-containing protein [Thiotrichales bacterium 19X7-9]